MICCERMDIETRWINQLNFIAFLHFLIEFMSNYTEANRPLRFRVWLQYAWSVLCNLLGGF